MNSLKYMKEYLEGFYGIHRSQDMWMHGKLNSWKILYLLILAGNTNV